MSASLIMMARILPSDKDIKKIICDAIGLSSIHDNDVDHNHDIGVKIKGVDYSVFIMNDTWDDYYGISGRPDNIVLLRYLTYGNGRMVEWEALNQLHVELEKYVRKFCDPIDVEFVIELAAAIYS